MHPDIDTALRDHFGFEEFRDGQREVIENLMAGKSAAAVFPTGSGKSLCFQLPAMLLPGLTLVVSPLIALMKDQIDALRARGISVQRLDSTLTAEQYRDVMNQVRGGELRMLYVAPERFNNERFRETILRTHVSLFAIDEAHCISEWGHNFRPDYLKLAEFAKLCKAERVLALTATATREVLDDMCRELQIEPECATCTGFYRSNLTLLTTPVDVTERDALLLQRLKERPPGPSIVYVTLQKTAEEVAERLSAAGLKAKAYHAGMHAETRAAVQDWFLETQSGIAVATIAFGMGVDKSNIRYVYHYNLPKSLENYSQEIGRSGRDGEESICEMFVCIDDLNTLENFIFGDTPTKSAVVSLLEDIFSQEPDFDVSFYELSQQHDIRTLVLRTLMTYLELQGFLEGGTPFYSNYQFKPILTSQQILEKFADDRREFLANVFRQASRKKTWFSLDVDQVAASIGSTRDRIVRALDYLGEQQMLEVKVAGVRNRYRRLKNPDTSELLADQLYQQVKDREARETDRLGQVLKLAGHDGCQVSFLNAHFDQALDAPCGHCSWCHQKQAAPLPSRVAAQVDEFVIQQANALRAGQPEVLAEPESLTRFLCGVTSPKLTRAKLTSHELFGSLAHVPFQVVLGRIRESQ